MKPQNSNPATKNPRADRKSARGPQNTTATKATAMPAKPTHRPDPRKPKRGRPFLDEPRRTTLPRVTTACHQHLAHYAAAHSLSLADALERAILRLKH